MKKTVMLCCLILFVATIAIAQTPAPKTAGNTTEAVPAVAITANSTPLDLARAAFMAQGGEKFRSVQNMVLRGSVNLYQPNSIQSIPGGFSIVTAGDKMRMEIDARPLVVFK